MRCPEVLIVGAGPHALTAASYLLQADPGLAGRIAVADPQPWLTAWHRHFARLQLTTLRSTCVHHPHPHPYALLDFARATGRTGELAGPSGQPTAALFDDFCLHLLDHHDLHAALLPATVTALHPRTDGRVEVQLGQVRLRVNHVVLAGNPVRPHVPLLAARHTDTLELDELPPLRDLCIVGGGLTAGHLALHQARRGTRVHLVARHPLRAQQTDVDPVWLGHALPDYLTRTPADRSRTVRSARQGSLPEPTLAALEVHPLVRLHHGHTVDSISRVGRWRAVTTSPTSRQRPGPTSPDLGQEQAITQDRGEPQALLVDDVWLATGQHLDVRFDPVTSRLLREVPIGTVGGLPDLDGDLSWGGTAIHLTGGLTALQTGPAARNLAGARIAAERYTACVAGSALPAHQYPQPDQQSAITGSGGPVRSAQVRPG